MVKNNFSLSEYVAISPGQLRTKAWFTAVSLASGLGAGELELLFAESEKQQKYEATGKRPRLWEKYSVGYVSPRFHRASGRYILVDRVEEKFTGTRKWFELPLWRVLEHHPMSMDEIKAVYMSLRPTISGIFIVGSHRKSDIFWRKEMSDMEKVIDYLVSLGDIESATAILTLSKEARLTQNAYLDYLCVEGWGECFYKLQADPILKTVASAINALVVRRFLSVRFYLNDRYCWFEEGSDGNLALVEEDKYGQSTPVIEI